MLAPPTYKQIAYLIHRFQDRNLSQQEWIQLDDWRNSSDKNKELFERLINPLYLERRRERMSKINMKEQWEDFVVRLETRGQYIGGRSNFKRFGGLMINHVGNNVYVLNCMETVLFMIIALSFVLFVMQF